MDMISAMFNEVVGPDKRNQQVARTPVRMLSAQFDLAGFNAATQTVGNGLSFDF